MFTPTYTNTHSPEKENKKTPTENHHKQQGERKKPTKQQEQKQQKQTNINSTTTMFTMLEFLLLPRKVPRLKKCNMPGFDKEFLHRSSNKTSDVVQYRGLIIFN